MLYHLLRQGATLFLQLATDDFLQLQHLGSCGVKKREHGADLFHRIPSAKGTEAEGHQCSLGLAQEVPDFLWLVCPGLKVHLGPRVGFGGLMTNN
jgi:hypothetical protein